MIVILIATLLQALYAMMYTSTEVYLLEGMHFGWDCSSAIIKLFKLKTSLSISINHVREHH